MVSDLFRFRRARPRDPEVEAWFAAPEPETRRLAQLWFERLRAAGPDVREVLHDTYPTACVEEAAFAYVAAFKAHANIGFFQGASLPDPKGLLDGAGKRMRHVKIRWGKPVDEAAVQALIAAAYADMRARLDAGG